MQNEYSSHYQDSERARAFLHMDEEILWMGHPHTSVPYRPPFVGVLTSLFFLGFSVFWTMMALLAGPMALFGVLFIVIGCFLFYNVVFGARKRLKNTLYVVTDRRALIITEGRHGTDCTEHVFARMQSVSIERVTGDAGTIRFREAAVYDEGMYYHRRRGYYNDAAREAELRSTFLMIDGVHTVHRMISERMSQE